MSTNSIIIVEEGGIVMQIFLDLKVVAESVSYFFMGALMISAFDVVTGVFNAFQKGDIYSHRLKYGVVKKVFTWSAVFVPAVAGLVFGDIDTAILAAKGAILFLTGVEILSIIENLEPQLPGVAKALRLAVGKWAQDNKKGDE